jgi:hypothetical protein
MKRAVVLVGIAMAPLIASAQSSGPFSGSWRLDLRSTEQRRANVDCGSASFMLKQEGSTVSGLYWYYSPGCGGLEEGAEVHGVVVQATAVLTVTSTRSDDIVMGTATLRNGSLHWQSGPTVKQGGGDANILSRGILKRERSRQGDDAQGTK